MEMVLRDGKAEREEEREKERGREGALFQCAAELAMQSLLRTSHL